MQTTRTQEERDERLADDRREAKLTEAYDRHEREQSQKVLHRRCDSCSREVPRGCAKTVEVLGVETELCCVCVGIEHEDCDACAECSEICPECRGTDCGGERQHDQERKESAQEEREYNDEGGAL